VSQLPQHLLNAVYATPDEDAPRPTCADWCEQHGDPDRARYIRLQCSLEQLPEPIRGWTSEGEEEIRLRRNWNRWLEDRPTEGVKWEFLRGFPEVAVFESLTAAEELQEEVFRHPVRRLVFRGLRGSSRLPRLPVLARVRELVVANCKLGDGLRRLLESPHLPALTRLELPYNGFGNVAAELLASSPRLSDLEYLELGNYWAHGIVNPLGSRGACALAASSHLGKLRYLGLTRTEIGDEGIAALARSPALAGLTALDAAGNGITSAGIGAVSRAGAWPQLRSLRLEQNPFGDTGLAELAGADRWRHLLALNLGRAMLGDAAVAALVGASWSERLEYLWLHQNAISDAGARALAGSPRLRALVFLYLTHNLIGDDGAWALGQSPHLTALRKLHLRDNAIRNDLCRTVERRYRETNPAALDGMAPAQAVPVVAVAAPPPPSRSAVHDENTLLQAIGDDPDDDLPRLAYADWLEENGRSDHAWLLRHQLSGRPGPADGRDRVVRFNLVNDRVGPLRPHIASGEIRRGLLHVRMEMRTFLSRAFQAVGADRFRQVGVEGLHLVGNTSTFERVANSPVLAVIRDLELQCNRLNDAGLRALATGPVFPSLHTLTLNTGVVGDSGMEALAASGSFPRLRRLTLLHLGYFDLRGFQALGSWPSVGHLRAFGLSGFRIRDIHLSALFRSGTLSSLRRLSLDEIYLTDTGVRGLTSLACLAGLRRLSLRGSSLTDVGVAALLEAPFLAGLEHLDLALNHAITGAGVRLLAECPALARLRSLNLDHCALDADTVLTLLRSPHLRNLQQLFLPHYRLEGEGEALYRERFATRSEAGLT
jgi:uncharacterized protein (TIGR02996 family)